MVGFIPKSPEKYNYFHNEQIEINDTFHNESQQQDPVLRQHFLWKKTGFLFLL